MRDLLSGQQGRAIDDRWLPAIPGLRTALQGRTFTGVVHSDVGFGVFFSWTRWLEPDFTTSTNEFYFYDYP